MALEAVSRIAGVCDAGGADGLQQRQAVEVGQHAVEDQGVEAAVDARASAPRGRRRWPRRCSRSRAGPWRGSPGCRRRPRRPGCAATSGVPPLGPAGPGGPAAGCTASGEPDADEDLRAVAVDLHQHRVGRGWPRSPFRRRPARARPVSPTCTITSPTSSPASAARPLPSSEVMTTPLDVLGAAASCSRAAGVTAASVAPSLLGGGAVARRRRCSAAAMRLGVEPAERELDRRSRRRRAAPRPSTVLVGRGGGDELRQLAARLRPACRRSSGSRRRSRACRPTGRRHHVGDQRAVRVVEAEGGGDLRGHGLDGHAEPAALDRAASRAAAPPRSRRCSDGMAKPTPTEPPFGE